MCALGLSVPISSLIFVFFSRENHFCSVCRAVNKVRGFNVNGLQEIILAINIRIKCSDISAPRFLANSDFAMSLNKHFINLLLKEGLLSCSVGVRQDA